MSIWALIPAAAGLGLTYANRPRKKEYMINTDYIDRYIANLKGKRAGREVYHLAMQPALRAIGKQAGKMQRQIDYDVARSGMKGTGVEAQYRLSAQEKALEATQQAHEQATQRQLLENRRTEQGIERMTMQKGYLEEQGRRHYDIAKRHYRGQMIGAVTSLGSQLIGAYTQNIRRGQQYQQALQFGEVLERIAKGEIESVDQIRKEYPKLSPQGITEASRKLTGDIGQASEKIDFQFNRIQREYPEELSILSKHFGYNKTNELLEAIHKGEVDIDLDEVEHYARKNKKRLESIGEESKTIQNRYLELVGKYGQNRLKQSMQRLGMTRENIGEPELAGLKYDLQQKQTIESKINLIQEKYANILPEALEAFGHDKNYLKPQDVQSGSIDLDYFINFLETNKKISIQSGKKINELNKELKKLTSKYGWKSIVQTSSELGIENIEELPSAISNNPLFLGELEHSLESKKEYEESLLSPEVQQIKLYATEENAMVQEIMNYRDAYIDKLPAKDISMIENEARNLAHKQDALSKEKSKNLKNANSYFVNKESLRSRMDLISRLFKGSSSSVEAKNNIYTIIKNNPNFIMGKQMSELHKKINSFVTGLDISNIPMAFDTGDASMNIIFTSSLADENKKMQIANFLKKYVNAMFHRDITPLYEFQEGNNDHISQGLDTFEY